MIAKKYLHLCISRISKILQRDVINTSLKFSNKKTNAWSRDITFHIRQITFAICLVILNSAEVCIICNMCVW